MEVALNIWHRVIAFASACSRTPLLLQVVKDVALLVRACLEDAVPLTVPLKTKVRCGRSWGALHEVFVILISMMTMIPFCFLASVICSIPSLRSLMEGSS